MLLTKSNSRAGQIDGEVINVILCVFSGPNISPPLSPSPPELTIFPPAEMLTSPTSSVNSNGLTSNSRARWVLLEYFVHGGPSRYTLPFVDIKTKVPRHSTVHVLRVAHMILKETKQHPGTAGSDNMLGRCLVSFHFLLAILSTSTV